MSDGHPAIGSREVEVAIDSLHAAVDGLGPVAVAVSGGVDSMTLATVVCAQLGAGATMVHAVSPAVPLVATRRVRSHADQYGWSLLLMDAGEFADPSYLSNPANRCFFCKSNLYGAMARRTGRKLLSGTNLDDLSDWRPGLKAAANHDVAHPFVEAGIDKSMIRAIARHLGLDDLAELPAAPCLSSRVETGIAIEAETLIAIDRVETALRSRLTPATARCRVRKTGVVVELDDETLAGLEVGVRNDVSTCVQEAFADKSVVASIAPYTRGGAFLRR